MTKARTRAHKAFFATLTLLVVSWSTGFGLIAPQNVTAAPGVWPSAWNPVMYMGSPVSDYEERGGCDDLTTGGSAVSPDEADIASEADCKGPSLVNPGSAPSMYQVYNDVNADTVDCSTASDDELFYRTRYAGDPYHNATNGMKNSVWEIHLDVTGDTVADYHIVLDGNPQQASEVLELVDDSYTTLWSTSTAPANGYVRVLTTPETPPNDDSSHEEYFMDVMVPVSAFPANTVCSADDVAVAQVTTAQETNDPRSKDSLFGVAAASELNLTIDKSVDNSTPEIGTDIVYTIVVTNEGPDDANNVIATDLLPTEVTYVGDDSVGAYDHTTGTWIIGTIPSGSSAIVNITATVTDGAGETVVNTAEVDAAEDETNEEDNIDTADIMPWERVIEGFDLGVTKTVDDSTPDVGGQVTYTIIVSNNGAIDSSVVVVNDLLPVGVTYVSDDSGGDYDDSTGVWTVGALAAGESATINIVADVDAGTANTTINNEACVDSDEQLRDLDPDNDCSDVDITPQAVVVVDPQSDDLDIAVEETVSDPTPNEGDTISFTITARNLGPVAATGLQLSGLLPTGVTYVSSAGVGSYDPSTNLWTIGNLGVGNSAVLTISVTVDAGTGGQTLQSDAALAAVDQNDTDPSNNQDNASITIPVIAAAQEPAPQETDNTSASLAETGAAGYLPMLVGGLMLTVLAGLTLTSRRSSAASR